jgi:hypothetical protein
MGNPAIVFRDRRPEAVRNEARPAHEMFPYSFFAIAPRFAVKVISLQRPVAVGGCSSRRLPGILFRSSIILEGSRVTGVNLENA